MGRRSIDRNTVHVILIAVVGLLVYSNTFHVPFLFDDSYYIVDNPIIKDFSYFLDTSKANELNIHTVTKRYLNTRYVLYLSFFANYKLAGLNPQSYHAVNISLHVFCSLLLYVIVRLTFGTPALKDSSLKPHKSTIALFSALLFAVHPIQTESVTYISQRAGLLAAVFCLGSVASYAGSRLSLDRKGKWGLYALCLVSAVLAMKSKENAFTLPLAIVLYEFLFLKDAGWKKMLLVLPLLLTMVIIPFEYISERLELGDITSALSEGSRLDTDIPRTDYLLTELTVIARYIRLIVFPVGQNLDHDWPAYHSFLDPSVMLSLVLVLTALSFACFLLYRSRKDKGEQRLVAFSIIWFFLSLSVESGPIPISEFIFEYRVYLPSIGAILALVTGAFMAVNKLDDEGQKAGGWPIAILSLITIILMGATYARNTLWQNEINLWSDVVKKSPQKARGHYNLGLAYKAAGLFERAAEHYKTALILEPDFALAFKNLGRAYSDNGNKGQLDKATEHYETAISLWGDNAETHNDLGNAYRAVGLLDKAIEHYTIAINLDPDYAEAYNNLGSVFGERGLFEKAIEHYQTAIHLDSRYATPYVNLGNAYRAMGLFDKAIENYQTAVRLEPDFIMAYNNLGNTYRAMGLFNKAIENYIIALSIDQSFVMAHNNLGNVYADMGQNDKAIEHYTIAINLDTDYAEAYNNIGLIYASSGFFDKAIEYYETAIRIWPDFAIAHNNLGLAYRTMGLPNKSIEHFKIATNLNPNNESYHFNLGITFFSMGIMEEARGELNLTLQINPENQIAREYLNRIK